MNRLQFWILTSTSSLVALLYLLQIILSILLSSAQTQLAQDQAVVENGKQYYIIWRQTATRVLQASPQDPAMHDILVRQGINPQQAAPASGQAGQTGQ